LYPRTYTACLIFHSNIPSFVSETINYSKPINQCVRNSRQPEAASEKHTTARIIEHYLKKHIGHTGRVIEYVRRRMHCAYKGIILNAGGKHYYYFVCTK
jgi:hypothetical protein